MFKDSNDYVILHWRGPIPIRVGAVVDGTAEQLFTEQHAYAYHGTEYNQQTLTKEHAEKLHEMLSRALGRLPTRSWRDLNLLVPGIGPMGALDTRARVFLLAFRAEGPASGVLVSHPNGTPDPNDRSLLPPHIDWTGFA